MRLGVYIDAVYDVVEGPIPAISTDRSFLLFVAEVGRAFDLLVLFGRARPAAEPAEYTLPRDTELVALPYYENLRRVVQVAAGVAGTARAFWRGLQQVDVVWVFGPHPFAVLLVCLALLRRKRIVLGVRQDSVQLYRMRLDGWRRAVALPVVRALDGVYRLLSRRLETTVQGLELECRYGGPRPSLLTMAESIVRAGDVADSPPERAWDGRIDLLTVGRLESEKNPFLLVDALAQVERDEPGRYRLVWVGRGPLEEPVRARVAAAGLDGAIDFRGYVPFDRGLFRLYQDAHAFVHVSLTEGMPKVLIEALAAAAPIVATDVGGVRAATGGGEAALLVPPDDVDALVAAVRALAADASLRRRVARRGLELARELTLERQAERAVAFIRSS